MTINFFVSFSRQQLQEEKAENEIAKRKVDLGFLKTKPLRPSIAVKRIQNAWQNTEE